GEEQHRGREVGHGDQTDIGVVLRRMAEAAGHAGRDQARGRHQEEEEDRASRRGNGIGPGFCVHQLRHPPWRGRSLGARRSAAERGKAARDAMVFGARTAWPHAWPRYVGLPIEAKESSMELGAFSVSLAVKDIEA